MSKFKVGQKVMLNPDIDEDDFIYGRADVTYEEVGKVQSIDGGTVRVWWPSYGGSWGGDHTELIPAEMENI